MSDYELHADYDNNGTLTASVSEYKSRITLGGAVVLPNIDADGRALPQKVEKSGPATLDRDQPVRTGADNELLPLRIRVVKKSVPAGSQFFLRLTGQISAHVRLFDRNGRPIQRDPAKGFPLALDTASLDLQFELRTFAGSPLRAKDRIYGMGEEDLSMTLVAIDPAGNETKLDEGPCRIAPWLIPSNNERVTRLYMLDVEDNEPSRRDVTAAMGSTGVPLTLVPSDITTDAWLQDQFQHGIAYGPRGLMHVILHLPRLRMDVVDFSFDAPSNLAEFVISHFPSRDVAVLQDFWERTFPLQGTDGKARNLDLTETFLLNKIMNFVLRLGRIVEALQSRLGIEVTSINTWFDYRERAAALRDVFREAEQAAAADPRIAKTLEPLLSNRQKLEKLLDKVEKEWMPLADDVKLPMRAGGSVEVTRDVANDYYQRINQVHASANAGGNIEAAPPTPNAPYGTIIVGNTRDADGQDTMDPDLLYFFGQQLQPVLELDTEWLKVGHVDEVIALVPSTGEPGFAVARASPAIGIALLRKALERFKKGLPPPSIPPSPTPRATGRGASPVTHMLRGKTWLQKWPDDGPQELSPPEIYKKLNKSDPNGFPYIEKPGARMYPAELTIEEFLDLEVDDKGRSVNATIESERMLPIEAKLKEALQGATICKLPVLFDATLTNATALLPDMLNMQIVNGHLLIPKPHGPRMKPADAIEIVKSVLSEEGLSRLSSKLTPQWLTSRGLDKTKVWIKPSPQVALETVGSTKIVFDGFQNFGSIRDEFMSGFPEMKEDDVLKKLISTNPTAVAGFLTKPQWNLIEVPENMVDLFEAYAQVVLEDLGATVHWVDSWYYHQGSGGIHCGTNAIRQPDVKKLKKWWSI